MYKNQIEDGNIELNDKITKKNLTNQMPLKSNHSAFSARKRQERAEEKERNWEDDVNKVTPHSI